MHLCSASRSAAFSSWYFSVGGIQGDVVCHVLYLTCNLNAFLLYYIVCCRLSRDYIAHMPRVYKPGGPLRFSGSFPSAVPRRTTKTLCDAEFSHYAPSWSKSFTEDLWISVLSDFSLVRYDCMVLVFSCIFLFFFIIICFVLSTFDCLSLTLLYLFYLIKGDVLYMFIFRFLIWL